MTLSVSILDQQFEIDSAHLCFASTTADKLQEIFDDNCSKMKLKEYPSILNNDVQPLVDKYLELKEHGCREAVIAFAKTALYTAIVGGLILSSFFGTAGLLPLGLIIAWFFLQVWMAYDLMQKVDAIESFNPEQKERKFPSTGLMFLALLPVAPLWEVYTRKKRIEEALSIGLPIKLEEAISFFEERAEDRYIEATYPAYRTDQIYKQALKDLFRLQTLCHSLKSNLEQ